MTGVFYKKKKFGCRDRVAQREVSVKRHREKMAIDKLSSA